MRADRRRAAVDRVAARLGAAAVSVAALAALAGLPAPARADDAGRGDGPRAEDAGLDAARSDAARPDAARPDAARPDAVRPDAVRPDARGAALLPVWEVGLGLSALSLPDYRGADTRHRYLLPVPYLVYRSPRLSVERGSLRADLFERGLFELDFSVNLSAPARSGGNTARAGMAALRPALELGPQLIATLWRSDTGSARLQFQLPLRYAFVLSRDTRDAGFVLHPRLNLDLRQPFGLAGWNVGLVAGPLFATGRHHDYFYTVDPAEATPTRPAYRAHGGYSGMQWTLAASKRFRHQWIGAFVRVDQLAGARFDDSPLVRRKTSLSAGIAATWVFAESAQRIGRR